MKKSSLLINNIIGSSATISISENLKKFPDVAKKMQICYATIADLLCVLDDQKYLSEDMFNFLDMRIQEEMNILDDCLVDVLWDDIEIDRYKRMEKYYHEVRSDAMDYLLSKIDPSYYDINARLQKMFDDLSGIILSLESHPFSHKHLKDFYLQMNAIKEILESQEYQEQLSVSQYHLRGDTYRSAIKYVKKIRSGK